MPTLSLTASVFQSHPASNCAADAQQASGHENIKHSSVPYERRMLNELCAPCTGDSQTEAKSV